MRRRESPKFADGGQEGTHLLHNGPSAPALALSVCLSDARGTFFAAPYSLHPSVPCPLGRPGKPETLHFNSSCARYVQVAITSRLPTLTLAGTTGTGGSGTKAMAPWRASTRMRRWFPRLEWICRTQRLQTCTSGVSAHLGVKTGLVPAECRAKPWSERLQAQRTIGLAQRIRGRACCCRLRSPSLPLLSFRDQLPCLQPRCDDPAAHHPPSQVCSHARILRYTQESRKHPPARDMRP